MQDIYTTDKVDEGLYSTAHQQGPDQLYIK